MYNKSIYLEISNFEYVVGLILKFDNINMLKSEKYSNIEKLNRYKKSIHEYNINKGKYITIYIDNHNKTFGWDIRYYV